MSTVLFSLAVIGFLQPVGTGPIVTAVEPGTITAYAPASLAVRGERFAPGCRVLIGVAGNMVAVPTQVQGPGEIRVELGLGLGPRPPQRQLVVDCGKAGASAPVGLLVERAHRGATVTPTAAVPAGGGDSPAVAETSASSTLPPPALERLEPLQVEAGRTVTLTLKGSGFVEGAKVRILANLNAGSSQPPRYGLRDFAGDVLSDTVITIDLDRGFAPSPRLREVVVLNPDGKTSAPRFLEITRRMP